MFRKLLTIALPLALAIALPLAVTEADAGGGSKLLPKASRWSQIPENASKEEIKAICDAMIAHEDDSPLAMDDASMLYLHGKIHNVVCIKVDYYKALVLAKASGDAFTLKATLTYVHERTNAGVEKAIKALAKFEREQ